LTTSKPTPNLPQSPQSPVLKGLPILARSSLAGISSLISRGEQKRAEYVLFHKTNLPIAVVEAKDNTHPIGHGMQQALKYAEMTNVPFAFSSNGDGFLFYDSTNPSPPSKSSGDSGNPKPKSEFYSSPIATSSSIKPNKMTSPPSARP
jgi:type I site-specific restriction endonuclease